MSTAMARQYRSAKNLFDVNLKDLEVIGKDVALGGAGGGAVALLTALNKGSADYVVQGHKIPLDGAAGLLGGLVGHKLKSDAITLAAAGATGAFFARTLTPVFVKNLGIHGDGPYEAEMGWGAEDPLVESAKYL